MRTPVRTTRRPVDSRTPQRHHRDTTGRHKARPPGNGRRRRATVFYHPGWGNHAEELLFHTSRYYACTEEFLRRISGIGSFEFGAYRAQRLAAEDRDAMARLLRRPPGHATARAVITLVYRLQGCGGRPVHRLLRISRPARPLPDKTHSRHHPADLPAEDPLLNLADRFGLRVRRQGRHLWIPYAALRPFLDASNPALRQAFQDAIEQLHEGGFHLHGVRDGE